MTSPSMKIFLLIQERKVTEKEDPYIPEKTSIHDMQLIWGKTISQANTKTALLILLDK